MSKPISSTPRSDPQSETDTETSSRVSTTSSSEQGSASEDGSEKLERAPLMTTRQTSNAALTTPVKHNTNSSAPPQAAMTSSSPTVKNRQTGDQKIARYGQAHNLPAYQRDTDIKKIKIEKEGGAADIQQAPKPDNRWDKFTKAVTMDGKLSLKNSREIEMSELAAWLRTSPTSLRALTITDCNMGDGDAITLSGALLVNTSLSELDLSSNAIGAKGAAALADALKVNKTLSSLNLRQNSIGAKGAAALADALKVNKTLSRLNLPQNSIGPEGTVALANALKVNTTLIKLDVARNLSGSEGALALANALKVNRTLITVEFDLLGNPRFFDDTEFWEIRQKIDDLLERNRHRKKLLPDAEGGLHLFMRHSPVLRDVFVPKDVVTVLNQHLPNDVLAFFAKEGEKTLPASAPSITTTTSNSTTTTTNTSDSTTQTTLITSPVALTTDPSSSIPSMTESTATEATINALLAAPSPDVALLRWIDGHVNPAATLNWVDPANGFTLLHYAVEVQQIPVIRSLLIRGIDRKKQDHNNQTASQLAQARADSSSSGVAADIAALLRRVENNRGYL
ncbi:Leucine-rich repeat [Oxalobacteraceae bacterium]